MRTAILLLMTASFSFPACATEINGSFHCLQGTKKTKETFQELKFRFEKGVLRSLSYSNRLVFTVSGIPFGCNLNANGRDRDEVWTRNGTTTKITYRGAAEFSKVVPAVIVNNEPSTVTVTFDGSSGYFCGAKAPSQTRLFSTSRRSNAHLLDQTCSSAS